MIGTGWAEGYETPEGMKKGNQKNRQSCCYLKPKEERIWSSEASQIVVKLRTKGAPLDLAVRRILQTL